METLRTVDLADGVDRAGERRDDAAWLEAAYATARIVPVWRGRCLLARHEPATALSVARGAYGELEAPVFLGVAGGDAYVAASLAADDERAALARFGASPADCRFADLRATATMLPPAAFGLLAYARGLVHWNAHARFCPECGAPTRSDSGGHVRTCTDPADGTRHFPRTDPAAIVLVHDGDRALLGRQASWPPGRYSTLAGFCEPGESLEETVVREVREESGVRVTDVRLRGSQAWPFPRSLMLGCYARALTAEIVRGEELEDVRWFTRAEVGELERSTAIALAGVDTIAMRLIRAWTRGEHEA